MALVVTGLPLLFNLISSHERPVTGSNSVLNLTKHAAIRIPHLLTSGTILILLDYQLVSKESFFSCLSSSNWTDYFVISRQKRPAHRTYVSSLVTQKLTPSVGDTSLFPWWDTFRFVEAERHMMNNWEASDTNVGQQGSRFHPHATGRWRYTEKREHILEPVM